MSVAFLSAQRSKDPNRQVGSLPIPRGLNRGEGRRKERGRAGNTDIDFDFDRH